MPLASALSRRPAFLLHGNAMGTTATTLRCEVCSLTGAVLAGVVVQRRRRRQRRQHSVQRRLVAGAHHQRRPGLPRLHARRPADLRG